MDGTQDNTDMVKHTHNRYNHTTRSLRDGLALAVGVGIFYFIYLAFMAKFVWFWSLFL